MMNIKTKIIIITLATTGLIYSAFSELGRTAEDYRNMSDTTQNQALVEQLSHFRGVRDSFPNHEVTNLMIERLFAESDCKYTYGGQWPLGYAQQGKGNVECSVGNTPSEICYAAQITCSSPSLGTITIDKAVYMAPKGDCSKVSPKTAALNSIDGLGTNGFN